MTSPTSDSFNLPLPSNPVRPAATEGLRRVLNHLGTTLERDELVQETVCNLRDTLKVDRVVLYYFYRQWHGRVTFEAISAEEFSIFGTTGPDECFNDEYAALYLAGRVRAIPNIEVEPIQPCHRDFLRQMKVQANLVVPVLTAKGLWGLLVAHHCQSPYFWSDIDVERVRQAAEKLATSPAIQES